MTTKRINNLNEGQFSLSSISADSPIAIVGLGYVGLPLAVLLSSKFDVLGFDIDSSRISELNDGYDKTFEINDPNKLKNKSLKFTGDQQSLKKCPVIIVAVPTPIDNYTVPDLTPLKSASRLVGENLSKGCLVVFESTVYPGLTEGLCLEEIERASSLKFNKDFYLGYSPERVNPGDKKRTIDKIVKVVSASTDEALDFMDKIYGSVVSAGIHRAPNIKTAEAAKIIENTQRDINIALMNELSKVFDRFGIDTLDVLEAARTKWNFMDFRPGLVGGHCIGVDPYYLTYAAKSTGYDSDIITSGRRINDAMAGFVAEKTIKLVLNNKKTGKELPASILILGAAFKENVPDLRNTKIKELSDALEAFGAKVSIIDPLVDKEEFHEYFGFPLADWREIPSFDAVIYGVPHKIFYDEYSPDRITEKIDPESGIVIDMKGMFSRKSFEDKNLKVWRL